MYEEQTPDERRAPVRVSTRTYYSGEHAVEIFVNGRALGSQTFRLTV